MPSNTLGADRAGCLTMQVRREGREPPQSLQLQFLILIQHLGAEYLADTQGRRGGRGWGQQGPGAGDSRDLELGCSHPS